MANSNVKSVQGAGSFENDFGTIQDNPELPHHGKKLLYKFEYEMEDGTILTANHKTDTSPFPAGTEVEYEVTKTHPEYGKSGKVTKPDSGNYKGSNASKGSGNDDARQLMICRQSSLNRAVEICIHNAETYADKSKEPVDELAVIELAERLTKWVMQPDNTQKVTPEKPQNEATPPISTPELPAVEEENSDLPF